MVITVARHWRNQRDARYKRELENYHKAMAGRREGIFLDFSDLARMGAVALSPRRRGRATSCQFGEICLKGGSRGA